jgi:abortive infection bacteriophage resistance protein
MKYTKPPLSFDQQAELLIARGLVADKADLEVFLSNVNYYRFSGYLYPFRSKAGDNYLPGTTLELIRNIYTTLTLNYGYLLYRPLR